MTRLKVNGKRARRTGVVVASVAVLGMAVAPGIAWASNPISDGSPVAVRSIATAPSELGVAPEVACGVAAPISDEELQKLIDEGGKVVRAEEAGTAAVTIEVPSEAATFVAREGVPALRPSNGLRPPKVFRQRCSTWPVSLRWRKALPCHARLPRADERKKLRMNRFDLERYGRTQLGLEVGQACR